MKLLIKVFIYFIYFSLIHRITRINNSKNLSKFVDVIYLFSFRRIKGSNNAGDSSILEFVKIFGETIKQNSVEQQNLNHFFIKKNKISTIKRKIYIVRDLISFVVFDILRRFKFVEAELIYYATDVFFKRIDKRTFFLKKKLIEFGTRRIEKTVWKNADYIFANREDELELIYVSNKNISLVPAQSRPRLDLPIKPPIKQKPLNFIFVGSSGNIPNRISIINFIDQYWKSILLHYPESTLKIVGGGWDKYINTKKGVVLTGFLSVNELLNNYKMAHFAVGYLEYGAGVKGKILEAMQHKKIVLGNEIGFEGIGCSALKPFLNLESILNLIEYYLDPKNYKLDINVYDRFLEENYNKMKIEKEIKIALKNLYGNGNFI